MGGGGTHILSPKRISCPVLLAGRELGQEFEQRKTRLTTPVRDSFRHLLELLQVQM